MSSGNIINSRQYEQHVPAAVTFSSKERNWQGILLTGYQYPRQVEPNPRPGTEDHILGYIASGAQSGAYCYASDSWRPYASTKGDWIIQQAFENQQVDFHWNACCDAVVPLFSYLIHISPKLLKKSALESFDKNDGEVELPHQIGFQDSLMESLVFAVKREMEFGNPGGRLYVETATELLAIHLLQRYCRLRGRTPSPRIGFPSQRLGRVIDYIHVNLDQDLSLNCLADIACLSTYHFARTFKKAIGRAPHQYVMQCRLEKARILLTTTDRSITQIALDTGWRNPSTFSTIFKAQAGMVPSKYRKNR